MTVVGLCSYGSLSRDDNTIYGQFIVNSDADAFSVKRKLQYMEKSVQKIKIHGKICPEN